MSIDPEAVPELSIDASVRVGERELRYDLSVSRGEHVTVIGPNGAGKSTLLRTLAGLQRVADGAVHVRSLVVDEPATKTFIAPHHRDVVLQPQAGALFPHLTVLDNVAFAPRSRGASRRSARADAAVILERVGIVDLAERRPRELSGGQVGKVALARSLNSGSAVLLLDEPAAALDVEARAELRHHLNDLDATVVTVTHDPVEARLLGNRIVVVDHGRVLQSGTAIQVAASPRSRWVASLLGVNIVSGTAAGTTVMLDSTSLTLAEAAAGDVHVTFPANAVTLHRERPDGSARNAWPISVTGLSTDGNRVNVAFRGPFEGNALITTSAMTELGLRPGADCWASVKATELTVLPA
jgi:molybdate transport system ATP-binding protein